MGRRRRRSRGGGVSRRRFLAGGLLGIGGASILGGTQAFSQVDATRATAVQTAGDQNALLGVDPVASVQQGDEGVDFVTLTNNTDRALDVTISLDDPSQGSVSPSATTIASGASTTITIDVAWDSPIGTNALPFSVSATDDASLSISLTRAVDVKEGPKLNQQVFDATQNNNAAYDISYEVTNVSDFDEIGIYVENISSSNIGTTDYTLQNGQGTVDYPPDGGSDGGAQGDTYEFRYRVHDANGQISRLDTTVQDIADGDDPNGDDMGGPDDPKLVSFTLTDDTQNDNTQLTVDYELENYSDDTNVEVTFDDTEDNWADQTHSTSESPTGTVYYPDDNPNRTQGGLSGDTFDVTIEVFNSNGIPVNENTLSIVAGSNDTKQWTA